jgi:hypothetical protein
VVVVLPPPVDLGFVEVVKGLEFEEFPAEVAVEGFDVGGSARGARLDVAGGDAGPAAPVFECLGDEFGDVVAADMGGCLSALDEVVEDADGLVGVDRAGGEAGEGLAGVLVGDVEDLLIGRPSGVASKRWSSAQTWL